MAFFAAFRRVRLNFQLFSIRFLGNVSARLICHLLLVLLSRSCEFVAPFLLICGVLMIQLMLFVGFHATLSPFSCRAVSKCSYFTCCACIGDFFVLMSCCFRVPFTSLLASSNLSLLFSPAVVPRLVTRRVGAVQGGGLDALANTTD